MSTLLYIHGFLSSPGSHKAQLTQQWLARHRPDIRYLCPYLSPYPEQTERQLTEIVDSVGVDELGLVGSSLGGFWSTWLVERYGMKAVIINPSVAPHRLVDRVEDQPQHNYHTDDTYIMRAEHGEQFRQRYPQQLQHKHCYWLLAQTGDETLDYREAEQRYQGCLQTIEQGGDHAFQGYETKIPAVIDFLFG